MAIIEQLEEFNEFAKRLAEERGDEVTLDEAISKWQQVDRDEVALLKERHERYLAEGPGQPADEAMGELRDRLVAKHGGS